MDRKAIEAVMADAHRRIFNTLANGEIRPGGEASRDLVAAMCALKDALDAMPKYGQIKAVCASCGAKVGAHESDGVLRVEICAKCERETIRGAAEDARTDAASNRGEW